MCVYEREGERERKMREQRWVIKKKEGKFM